MEKIKMYINSVVPEPISHDGKTGSIVRLEKILKEFAKLGMGGCITINSTQWMADYFKENGVDVEFRIVKSSQKFRGYLGLCLKSVFLIIISFFVVFELL